MTLFSQLRKFTPQQVHGITDNDVLVIGCLTIEFRNPENLGIRELFAQLDEKPEKGSTLIHGFGATGILVNEPCLRSEGTAVVDANSASVVLVGIVNGTLDEVDCLTDVDGIEDNSLFCNCEVVSEERHSTATRLIVVILAV